MKIQEKKEKMGKKGEISTAFLVTTLFAVAGFILLLVFLYNTLVPKNIDSEVCHQSVIFRATIPTLTEQFIPLKCKTKKICITSAGLFNSGNCPDFKGETGITTVKVKSEREIEQLFSQEIVDCWTMMGEGKLDLFTSATKVFGVGGRIGSSCVICSRIAFDKEALLKKGIDPDKINIELYMMTHKVQDSNFSYLEYIAGYNGKVNVAENLLKNLNSEMTTEDKTNLNGVSLPDKTGALDKSGFDKSSAILFMQISAPKQADSAKNVGNLLLGVGIGSFATAPVATGKLVTSSVKACGSSLAGGLICAGILAVAAIGQQGWVAYNRAIAAGYCGDSYIGTEARNGCSVVRTVNYDAEAIAQYCKNIESIP